MSQPIPTGLPRVPISSFKANPAAYLTSGALVTNHGKPRAVFMPVGVDPEPGTVATAKARLRLLHSLNDGDEIQEELAELSRRRDQERVGEPR